MSYHVMQSHVILPHIESIFFLPNHIFVMIQCKVARPPTYHKSRDKPAEVRDE